MTGNDADYTGYVAAAYAVFVVVLLWDVLAPAVRIRRVLRAVALRARRGAARAPLPTELKR